MPNADVRQTLLDVDAVIAELEQYKEKLEFNPDDTNAARHVSQAFRMLSNLLPEDDIDEDFADDLLSDDNYDDT